MTVRFGASPIAWINDDMPELGGDTPLERVLGDVREIGFAGVELGGKFPKEPAALKALLRAHGLDLVGGWYSAELLSRSANEEIEALQSHLALLKAMDSQVWVHAETSNAIHGQRAIPLSAAPRLPDGGWREFGHRVTQVADYIQGQGLKFAYHHHVGTVVERPADLQAFIAATGESVGLTLDTGHAALGGIDAVEAMRAHRSRIAHVHCKDVRGKVFAHARDQDRSFLDGVLAGIFTVPGDGDLNYGDVMRALAAIGYSGWIILEAEQDPAKADPRAYAEVGLATLRREAQAAGLTLTP